MTFCIVVTIFKAWIDEFIAVIAMFFDSGIVQKYIIGIVF